MLALLLLILIVVWLFDYIPIEGLPVPDLTVFSFYDHPITLWSILILIFVAWAVSLAPTPIKIIIILLLLIWILTILGFVVIADIPVASILVLAIIFFITISILRPSDN